MSGLPEQALEFWKRAAILAPDDEMLARKVKNKTYFYEDKKGKAKQAADDRDKPFKSGASKPDTSKPKPSKQKH